MSCIKCGEPERSHGYCNSCVQTVTYQEKYPELKVILSQDSYSNLYEVKKVPADYLVSAKCQQCDSISEIRLHSLIKVHLNNPKDGRSPYVKYRCLVCSKKGHSGIGLEEVMFLIDLPATTEKFGGLPTSRKAGSVVIKCEDCLESQEVRLQSVLNQARRHRLNGRSCLYKCFKCGVRREDALAKVNATRVSQLSSGFKSGLELAMEARLKLLGIKYTPQFQIDMYVCDFFLNDYNVILEVNGEYWHDLPENKSKDKAKRTYISRYYPQYKIVTIEERNFFNPLIVDKIIKTTLGLSDMLIIKDFDFKNVVMSTKTNDTDYSNFLNAYHYAKRGRKGKDVYEARLNGELIAVCKFNSPTRQTTSGYFGVKWTEIMELDRFCIHPEYQKKNFASWFISRCVNAIFSSSPKLNKLVSYADSTFGHAGTIYKASNWTKDGDTKPSYHYLDDHGIPINKKRVFDLASKMRMKEADYVAKHSLRKIREKPKSRYVFDRP
jgi:very-short-patch-repair endonuclease